LGALVADRHAAALIAHGLKPKHVALLSVLDAGAPELYQSYSVRFSIRKSERTRDESLIRVWGVPPPGLSRFRRLDLR
ncbi:hypothetical protein ABZ391_23975, partial [Kitasatospora cineracea]